MKRGSKLTLSGIYVDDDPEDQTYAEVLTREGDPGIKFVSITDLKDLILLRDEVLSGRPDAICLDYRLDENRQSHSGNTDFKGGALAQAIREKQDEDIDLSCPIILVSNEGKIRDFFKPEKTTHDLFDDYYSKEQLITEVDRVITEIESLALGYKQIQSLSGKENAHLELFDVGNDEWVLVGADDLIDDLESNDIVHVKSRYILSKFIKRMGPLLSANEVLARLGVHLESDNKTVQLLLDQLRIDKLKYTGIFSGGWERFWTHKFEDWCFEVFDAPRLSIPSSKKVEILNAKLGCELTPAVSRWMKTSDEAFSFLCSSCLQPTELKFSLAAYDPYRPSYVDGKRICFACIKTDQYLENGQRVAKSDERVKEKIQSGEVRGA